LYPSIKNILNIIRISVNLIIFYYYNLIILHSTIITIHINTLFYQLSIKYVYYSSTIIQWISF